MVFDFTNWLLEQSVKKGKFLNSPGNGKKVPEYKFKDGSLKKLVDKKTGEIITHNLYLDIQSFKSSNDYLKILKDNPNALNEVKLSMKSEGKGVAGIDFTKMGTFDDMIKANQSMKNAGFDDILALKKFVDSYITKKDQKDQELKKDVGEKKEGDK